ncbi:glutathione S-transferase [Methylomonas sp. SURF-2]|uniref:Glutathione S-transferase n=1 Tax=Methylomonas subterranea TaxID=2952225 RepID=A0ABT1TC62_9GAMM|nr:glutathione S-transferase [Methylomonas sp. SURF-2]MCQ8103041.1 glutathione S-transferase [Methylomonas sp. SURF-2]
MSIAQQEPPVLYSFRRCPYAMRARLAIAYAQITVELREIELRRKPAALLTASPKGTVPVLVLPSGRVVDESLDIMHWALQIHDPDHWLAAWRQADGPALIQRNDGDFKYYLDRYKYADRYPQYSMDYYRQHGERFLYELEQRLRQNAHLCGDCFSIADAAIAPFIRQFAAVDQAWFAQADYPALHRWLGKVLDSDLFHGIMRPYLTWTADSAAQLFGNPPSNRSN